MSEKIFEFEKSIKNLIQVKIFEFEKEVSIKNLKLVISEFENGIKKDHVGENF